MKVDKFDGIDFEIRKVGRAQNRELRKQGLDLFKKMFEMTAEAEECPLSGDEIDLILDTVYPDKQGDLDNLTLGGQLALSMAVLGESSTQAEEVKN